MRRFQSHTGQLGKAVRASAERSVVGSITGADAQLNELIKLKKGGAVAGLMAKYSAATVKEVAADKRTEWFADADKIVKGEAI